MVDEGSRTAGGPVVAAGYGVREVFSERLGKIKKEEFFMVSKSTKANGWVKGLGWFSIGMGIAEVVAPKSVAKLAGVKENRALFRFMGVREMATGIGLLSKRRPEVWMWGRVAGDAMDMAVLGAALRSPESNAARVALSMAAMVGVTAADVTSSINLSRKAPHIHVTSSVVIDRSAEELYQFWHNFENLPQIMNHLNSVKRLDENRWHWAAKGPVGTEIEWDAETINDKPNELIAWRSLENADVQNAGTVRFEPGPEGKGTLVKVELGYRPPAGALGAAVAALLGESPEQQIEEDLNRFKQLLETREIVRTEGQPV